MEIPSVPHIEEVLRHRAAQKPHQPPLLEGFRRLFQRRLVPFSINSSPIRKSLKVRNKNSIKKTHPNGRDGPLWPWYHPSFGLAFGPRNWNPSSPLGHSKTFYRCQPPRLTGISGGPLPGEFGILLPPDSHQSPALSGKVSLLLPFLAEIVVCNGKILSARYDLVKRT